MKNVQISEELFYMLLRFHLLEDDLWQEEIETGPQKKLDAIVNRNLYTQYKTAPTHEEQEQARQEYLDRKGVLPRLSMVSIFPYRPITGAWHAPVPANKRK